MSLTAPSDPKEVQEFQFKLACRLHVCNQNDEEYKGSYSMVATASKYGLLFVGCRNKIQAILLQRVLEMEHPTEQKSRGTSHCGAEIQNYPRREVLLPDIVTHLNVNCDQSLLAVAITKGGCAHALIYDIASFHGKTINLVKEVRLATSTEAHLLELSWNPGIANILASCLSNGTVAVYEFKNGGVDINTLAPEAQATCFSWSPKGKQLVVGSMNGTLTQHKPDLKAVKSIAAPNVFEGPASVLNVLWISNYQFAAIYKDSLNESERPSLLIVNAPKAGGISFVNYEDICYSSGDLRKPQFYLLHQQNWNVLIVGSANSMEVGVLGLSSDQLAWQQWLQEDASRAELPLSSSKEETFPLGVALDTSTQKQLPWGENQFLPPMPILILLSHRGVLCLFYVINTLPGAAILCTPPERLPDESGLAYFITAPTSSDTTLSTVPKEDDNSSQQILTNTPESNKPLEWTTPSGAVNINRMGLRINLTEKFENIAPSQPLNMAKPAFTFASSETPKSAETSVIEQSNTITAATAVAGSLTFGTKPLLGSGSLFSDLGSPQQLQLGAPSKENFVGSPSLPATSGQANATLNISSAAIATSTPNLFGAKTLHIQQQTGESQKSEQIPQQQQQQQQQQIFHQPFLQPQSQHLQQPQYLQQQQLHQPQPSSLSQQFPQQLQQQIQQNQLFQRNVQLQPESSALSNKQGSSVFGSLGDSKVASTTSNLFSGAIENKEIFPVATSSSNIDAEVVKQTKEMINTSVLYLAVQEEMDHFENEISQLKARLGKINMEVGTPEEKAQLRMKVDAMDNFCQELQETTNAQSSEVRALKAEMVESLAWVEDARSREAQENDPCWLQVIRSQELDPVSARYLANEKQLSYYVETQLFQADRSLELQWANFQESCRDKIKGRLYIPSLEAVYQAMVLQSNILLKQKANVKRIMERTAKHKTVKGGSLSILGTSIASIQSRSDTDLAALAENLLQMRLGAAGSSVAGENISEIMAAGRYSMVASMTRKLTPGKQSTLREFFSQSPVRHIRPIKPPISSLKHLSILEKHSKSQDIKSHEIISTEATPLGFLDKMVARISSDNLNGFNASTFGSTLKEKSEFNLEVVSKENVKTMNSVTAVGEPTADLLGQIAKSVVTKFKEPDNVHIGSVPSTGDECANSDNSTINKQNLPFSFAIPPPSIPIAKSKGTANFNFNSSSKQSTTPFGEGLSKSNTAASFSFHLPATPPSTSIFSGSSSKTSNFSFFSSGSPATTSAPVQFFGSLSSESSAVNTTSVPNTFSFASLSVSTTTATTTSVQSVFGDKAVSGPISVTTSQPMKTVQSPSIFGGTKVTNTASSFTFSVPPAASSSVPSSFTSGQIAQNTTKTVFGESLPRTTVDTITPDATSHPTINKTGTQSFNLFGTSVTASSVTTAVNTQISSSPTFSSGGKSTPGTSDFNLGQLQSALTLTPTSVSEASKEVTAEKLEISHGDTTSQSTSAPSSSVNVTSSTSTKPFTFSLSSVSSPASSVFTAKTSTSDNNDKNKTSVTSVSFFGQAVCSPTSFTQNTSIFGQKTTSAIFGGTATAPGTSNIPEEKKSVSNVPIATPNTLTATLTETTVASTTEALMPVTSTSVFGSSSLTTSLASLGTTPVTTTAATPTTTTSIASPLFATSVTTSSLFGNSLTTSNSLFGGATTTAAPGFAPNSNFFGQTNTTSTSSIFKPQSSSSAASVFGQPVTTSAGSIFGQPTTNSTSIFGQGAVTTAASIFGQSTTSTSTSVFGQPSASTAASIFGHQTVTTASSVFGQSTSTTAANVFGQPAVTTATSPFGQQAVTTTGPVFGQPVATTTSTSVFGSSTPSATIFGQPASTTSTNVFGQPANTPTAAFGGVSNAFGQASGSFMGGSQSTFGNSPGFGQSGGSIFGQSAGSGFGTSGGSIFGGSSSFGKSGALFQSPSGGSIFGGSPTSGGTTGGAFSAPQGQSIAESGFGSPSAFGQNKSGGFGSPPAFGQASTGSGFGGSPTFGGAPTFGGSPIFGNQNRVFGSSPPPASNIFGGGNAQQQSNTFESLASQNTMTFGNLASGQSPTFGSSGGSMFGGTSQPQPQAPAFQNTSSFGGSSFSSWR